jgi:hypothetical protein
MYAPVRVSASLRLSQPSTSTRPVDQPYRLPMYAYLVCAYLWNRACVRGHLRGVRETSSASLDVFRNACRPAMCVLVGKRCCS